MVGDKLKHLYVRSWHLPAEPQDIKDFVLERERSAVKEALEKVEKQVKAMKVKPDSSSEDYLMVSAWNDAVLGVCALLRSRITETP